MNWIKIEPGCELPPSLGYQSTSSEDVLTYTIDEGFDIAYYQNGLWRESVNNYRIEPTYYTRLEIPSNA